MQVEQMEAHPPLYCLLRDRAGRRRRVELCHRAGMADFDLLTKPPAAPPDWLFPIVWTILYLLMGIAMGLVWRSSSGRTRKEATALWSIQLAVNGLWPVLFFCWVHTGRRFSGSWG